MNPIPYAANASAKASKCNSNSRGIPNVSSQPPSLVYQHRTIWNWGDVQDTLSTILIFGRADLSFSDTPHPTFRYAEFLETEEYPYATLSYRADLQSSAFALEDEGFTVFDVPNVEIYPSYIDTLSLSHWWLDVIGWKCNVYVGRKVLAEIKILELEIANWWMWLTLLSLSILLHWITNHCSNFSSAKLPLVILRLNFGCFGGCWFDWLRGLRKRSFFWEVQWWSRKCITSWAASLSERWSWR